MGILNFGAIWDWDWEWNEPGCVYVCSSSTISRWRRKKGERKLILGVFGVLYGKGKGVYAGVSTEAGYVVYRL